MGVPTSEVGYTPAMPRTEDHEVHKDMWWGHWGKKYIGWFKIVASYVDYIHILRYSVTLTSS